MLKYITKEKTYEKRKGIKEVDDLVKDTQQLKLYVRRDSFYGELILKYRAADEATKQVVHDVLNTDDYED